MKSNLSLFSLLSLLLLACSGTSTSTQSPGGTEPPDLDPQIKSHVVGGVSVYVYLPPEYDESLSYPVVLINDGDTAFGTGLGLNSTLTRMIESGEIEPVIAVAVVSGRNRNNWYIPYDDPWVTQNWGSYTPSADKYAEIILDEILPFVEENYAAKPEATAMIGYSLGGLISTWMGLNYPDQIEYSASLSGSFWVADYAIFAEAEKKYDSGQKFWFDIGTAEWNYYVPMYSALESRGVEPGLRNFYYEVPNASHQIIFWKDRITYPLTLFYGDQEYEPRSMEVVLECIPSQSVPGRKFRRMNPIITLSNGVKYSLAHTATYTLLNDGGQIGSEGSFNRYEGQEMKVLVEYKDFSEEVVIRSNYCP